jgi:hypothetical protein
MTQKSRQSREMVKAIVNPMFAWSNAVLKGGEMMLNSMEAFAKNARTVRVAVLPDADAPQRKRSARRKAKSGNGGKRAKRRR